MILQIMKKILFAVAAVLGLAACNCSEQSAALQSGLDPAKFDTIIGGDTVKLYTLKNDKGMEVSITNYGGRVVSLVVPDKDGKPTDVVLGYDNIAQYADTVNSPSDYGSSVGRYANRIEGAKFTLNDTVYNLRPNDGPNCLHGGGNTGWMHKVLAAEQIGDSILKLTLKAEDGENGFPGNVTAVTTYKVTADNTLDITWEAETDKPTVINMTNHTYFNLTGSGNKDILAHTLWLNAKQMTPVDGTFMTTSEIVDIEEGSAFDFFTNAKAVGKDIEQNNEQLQNGHGYDHNWVLLANKSDQLNHAATLYCAETGIELKVKTSEPGIQVYAGNFLDGTVTGKRGEVYGHRHAICLETQKFPDTPNKPAWPSATLRAGEEYKSITEFCFGVRSKE